ncbi:MAG: glycosyltransferase family 9 protein [bacterium]
MQNKISAKNIKKILLIHLRRIGDILLCTPSIKAVREYYKDAEITFLTEGPFYEVLSGNPFLDNIILLEEDEKKDFKKYVKFLKKIHDNMFDLTIDFYGNPRSSLIAFISGAKHRVGFDYPLRQYFYNIRVPLNANERYVVQVKFDLLRQIGIEPVSEKLDIFIPQEAKNKVECFLKEKGINSSRGAAGRIDGLIAFSPTSRRKKRRWFPEKFAELGDRLINSDKKVIFILGPGEEDYVNSIVNMMKTKPVISFKSSIKESAAILERCRLLVTNFNGSKHIAQAVGTPTIGLCEPSEAPVWNPVSESHKAIYKNVSCAGCGKVDDCKDMSCMKLIEVDEVEKTVGEMINI